MNRPFVTIAVVCCLWLGGCSEQQAARLDDAAQSVNDSLPMAESLVDSPAGAMLGEQAKGYFKIGLMAIAGAAAAWQTFRRGQVEGTLKTVAKSIEKAPAQVQADLKADINRRMVESGSFATQNKVIDKAKS